MRLRSFWFRVSASGFGPYGISWLRNLWTLKLVLAAHVMQPTGPLDPTVEARKLEHHYPHALKVKYKGS